MLPTHLSLCIWWRKKKEKRGEKGEKKKKLTLVRIDLPLYPRLIQDARITRVYPLIELSREKIYSLVKTKHGCVLKLCVPACVLAAWFGDTSTVLLKATFHRPRDIKGGHTDPESAGYRIVPSPTDRHRDAYWRTVCERCSRDNESSVLLLPCFSRLTTATFEHVYRSKNFLRDFASLSSGEVSLSLPVTHSEWFYFPELVSMDRGNSRATEIMDDDGRWKEWNWAVYFCQVCLELRK